MNHHGRDNGITIGIYSIAIQECQSCQLWAAHDPMSRSWASASSSWAQMFILCKKSGVLTISCHDREHAPRARDHQVSLGLHFFKKSGALTILCHDREQAIPARDFQLVNFQRSLGRSRSAVTIVSMHVELVTIIHLSQKMTLGRSRSSSRSWARHFSSWLLADLNYNG